MINIKQENCDEALIYIFPLLIFKNSFLFQGLVPELKNAVVGDWPMPGSHRIHIHWQAIPVRPEWGYDEEALKVGTFLLVSLFAFFYFSVVFRTSYTIAMRRRTEC